MKETRVRARVEHRLAQGDSIWTYGIGVNQCVGESTCCTQPGWLTQCANNSVNTEPAEPVVNPAIKQSFPLYSCRGFPRIRTNGGRVKARQRSRRRAARNTGRPVRADRPRSEVSEVPVVAVRSVWYRILYTAPSRGEAVRLRAVEGLRADNRGESHVGV